MSDDPILTAAVEALPTDEFWDGHLHAADVVRGLKDQP